MFPIKDDNPTELPPLITWAIIAACVAVWWWVQGAGFSDRHLATSVCSFGVIPAEVTGQARGVGPELVEGVRCGFGGLTWGALFTSMFLHGSWMHLLGNLWFLWIFGNNVEDSMGHLRFLVFYLLTGLVAAGAQVVAEPASPLPMVGASGAISAIMGAYLVLYPRARVRTLLVLVVFITFVDLPAWVYLGYWFLLQVASGSMQAQGAGGGVAFWAHVGGFAAGLLLVIPFRNRKLVQAKRSRVKLGRDQIDHGGWW